MAYTVVRTDLMSGTKQPADLVSLRFYDGTGSSAAVADVENGVIAVLGNLEDAQREMWKGSAASSSSALTDCVLVATPEVMYDERKHNLDEFVNEAGVPARGYRLRSNNIFSVTKEGFVGGTVPTTVGAAVGIGAGGKIAASGTGFGTFIGSEIVGRYTYYAIKIGVVE